MKLIAKHLPLLALALLVGSTELRADDFPLQVGDIIKITTSSSSAEMTFRRVKLTNRKGKWIEVDGGGVGERMQIVYNGTNLFWLNSDYFTSVKKVDPSE